MHENPVRKGMVQIPQEYPYSTAHPDYEGEIDWAWLEGVAVAAESDETRSPANCSHGRIR